MTIATRRTHATPRRTSQRSGNTVDSLWSELGILADVRKARTKVTVEEFANVWDAIEPDPARRARLKLRSQLMAALCRRIGRWKIGRAEAAKRLKITPARYDALVEGHFTAFKLGELVDLAVRAGLEVTLTVAGAGQKSRARRAAGR